MPDLFLSLLMCYMRNMYLQDCMDIYTCNSYKVLRILEGSKEHIQSSRELVYGVLLF